MCGQREYDMDREDERAAVLKKKQEIQAKFGSPIGAMKHRKTGRKFKKFELRDTASVRLPFDTSATLEPRLPSYVCVLAPGFNCVSSLV